MPNFASASKPIIPPEMKRLASATAILFLTLGVYAQEKTDRSSKLDRIETFIADSIDNTEEILQTLQNLPNIEVGKGITFRPKNKSYEMTLRFRMQNMVGLSFGQDFGLTEAEERG